MVNTRKIIKKIIPVNLFGKIGPFVHLLEAVMANVRYNFPSHGMRVIGVTGTNGKTTTTFLIHKMLSEAGYKVGMMSTVAYGIGNDITSQSEHITTARAGILQKRLRDFKNAGVEWLVLEVSSHSLVQYRTWGVSYEIAVMTNVTGDHLDYHGTFDNYLEAKRRLFKITSKNKNGFGIINADDLNANKFTNITSQFTTYGV
ncbi:MAG: UDP-N-acetylmuramoyl-L-alanyl-D-glutamate--2,6-diaminopimelate ligase, partial [Patescibacteria group bacterium]|nr:UDP-N-acetylmuramoyl-L-alanyl-D-glutamate--2,6-diaminopimelate ligase [Patescibacteria group bacterium]